jgi:hypothetical protein
MKATFVSSFALAGCATTSSQSETHVIQASRLKAYSSLDELAADATVVVLLEATDEVATGLNGGIPYTTTRAVVVRVLGGTLVGQTIMLRQLGGSNTNLRDTIVMPGRTYIAFVNPFEFEKHRTEWVVVGEPAGLFVCDAGGFRNVDLDASSAGLPERVTLAEVVVTSAALGD